MKTKSYRLIKSTTTGTNPRTIWFIEELTWFGWVEIDDPPCFVTEKDAIHWLSVLRGEIPIATREIIA